MNFVWTNCAPFLQAVRDWVFCDGAANEGVDGTGIHVTNSAVVFCTREPCFAVA